MSRFLNGCPFLLRMARGSRYSYGETGRSGPAMVKGNHLACLAFAADRERRLISGTSLWNYCSIRTFPENSSIDSRIFHQTPGMSVRSVLQRLSSVLSKDLYPSVVTWTSIIYRTSRPLL